jgi:hypothetical protein
MFAATLAWEQMVTAAIRGTITDAVACTAKSGTNGGHDVQLLPVGTYRVAIAMLSIDLT